MAHLKFFAGGNGLQLPNTVIREEPENVGWLKISRTKRGGPDTAFDSVDGGERVKVEVDVSQLCRVRVIEFKLVLAVVRQGEDLEQKSGGVRQQLCTEKHEAEISCKTR
eukprot:297090-Prorocentrum_minimum.AAC.2